MRIAFLPNHPPVLASDRRQRILFGLILGALVLYEIWRALHFAPDGP